jgi:DNA-binding NarL/FixJ family response regulator
MTIPSHNHIPESWRQPEPQPSPKTVGLVLADQYPIVLEGMEHLFGLESDFRILECCTDGEQAVRAVRRHQPDVLILELRLPGKNGLTVLRELSDERMSTRPVLVTGSLSEDELLDGLRLGVKGVVLKEMPPRLLVQCVRKVSAGGTWLEKNSIGRAVDRMLRKETADREIERLLTPREIEMVRIAATGRRNREIAEKLNIVEGTVKTHLHNIYEKLSVRSRLELILYARDRGLI